jgi:hypothetical protein
MQRLELLQPKHGDCLHKLLGLRLQAAGSGCHFFNQCGVLLRDLVYL